AINQTRIFRLGPPTTISGWIGLALASILLIGLLFVSAVVALALLPIALVGGYLLRRKLRRMAAEGPTEQWRQPQGAPPVIDVEYEVVPREPAEPGRRDDRLPPGRR